MQRLTYYPYGATRTNESSATPTVDVPYKYTDQELDSSTELYYYGARYYDPALGRFLSPDTIVPDPQQPQDLNRYTYARNNPFGYTDPTGHEGEPAGGGWGWGWSWGNWYINPLFGPPILPPATMMPGLLLPMGDLGAQMQASALNPFGEVQRLGLGLDNLLKPGMLDEPPIMMPEIRVEAYHLPHVSDSVISEPSIGPVEAIAMAKMAFSGFSAVMGAGIHIIYY